MNLNSREIRRLSRFFFLNCLLKHGQQASACTFHHLFVRLPSLNVLGRLFVVSVSFV